MPLNIPVLSLLTLWNIHELFIINTISVRKSAPGSGHTHLIVLTWLLHYGNSFHAIYIVLYVCMHACMISHRNKYAVVLYVGFTYDGYLVQGMFLFFRLLHWHWVNQSVSEVTLKDIGNNSLYITTTKHNWSSAIWWAIWWFVENRTVRGANIWPSTAM